MEEKINLVPILKEWIGKEVYSPLLGTCIVRNIKKEDDEYPIEVEPQAKRGCGFESFAKNGEYYSYCMETSECLLWPSKDERSWAKYIKPPKPAIELKPFDKVLVRDDDVLNWGIELFVRYLESDERPFDCFCGHYKQCIPFNEETAHLFDTGDPAPKKYIQW